MLMELKTRQIDEYRKLLKTVLDGLDSASRLRHSLIELDSVSKYEQMKFDSMNDPEPFYHLKLFDKGIGICRMYSTRQYFVDDPDNKYYHFTIRIYNFVPNETHKLNYKRYRDHIDYGDFLDITDALKYFRSFCNQLISVVAEIPQYELMPIEIF